MKSVALKVLNLKKKYDTFILDIPFFSLNEGEINAFLGKNGAGKTTFLKLILNQIKVDEGKVLVFDKEISSSIAKENVGFSFTETPIIFPNFTGSEANIVMKGIYKNWDKRFFLNLLHTFNINSSKMYSELSTGMKVKFNLALAISHRPKILILDEVTSGLDPIARKDILNFLKETQNIQNTSILFSTHIIEDLEDIADSLTIIKDGKIILEDKMDEILTNYYFENQKVTVNEYILKLDNGSSENYLYKLGKNDKLPRPKLKDIIQFCLE